VREDPIALRSTEVIGRHPAIVSSNVVLQDLLCMITIALPILTSETNIVPSSAPTTTSSASATGSASSHHGRSNNTSNCKLKHHLEQQ